MEIKDIPRTTVAFIYIKKKGNIHQKQFSLKKKVRDFFLNMLLQEKAQKKYQITTINNG